MLAFFLYQLILRDALSKGIYENLILNRVLKTSSDPL